MKIFNIPGTSFSVRRAIGVDKIKRSISKAIGIPSTKQGLERKIGRSVIKGVGKCSSNSYFYFCTTLFIPSIISVALLLT